MTIEFKTIVQTLRNDPESRDALARCTNADEAAAVASAGGKTYISYGDTTIIVDGVEMTADEVWARRG